MDIRPQRNSRNPGVTRRQQRRRIGDFDNTHTIKQAEIKEGRSVSSPADSIQPEPFELDTSDIDEYKETAERKPRWRWLKLGYLRRNFSPRQFFKRLGLVGGTLVLFVVGFLSFKLFFAAQNIIDRDSGGALALQGDPSLLKGEGDGRVNILLIGEGGEAHDGGSRLADTIIVASIDPFNHEAALVSIPRDTRVEIPGYGLSKINAAHAYGEQFGFEETDYPNGGPGLLQKTVEKFFDIPIHYYARVDFRGLERAIDNVGGVEINVEETLYDPSIAWEYGFSTIEAGYQTFNSKEALFYSRSRVTTSDFDRGERQREVIIALKNKALSTSTLANPVKIGELISTAGNHFKTNLEISEMVRLFEIGQQISEDKIVSSDIVEYLINAGDGSTDYVPKAGTPIEIQRYVRSIFIDGLIKQEAAAVDILNGTNSAGLATESAELLKSYGYNVVNVSDAPEKGYSATRLYAVNAGNTPVTQRYLEQRLNTVALSASDLPEGVETTSAFVIILGNDATR